LFAYGLGKDRSGPWIKRIGERWGKPADLLLEELWGAARANRFDRVRLLVEHGADVTRPGIRNGRTAYEEAQLAGNGEIAQYLLEHGAKEVSLDVKERFAAACVAGRRDEALAIRENNSQIVDQLGEDRRSEVVHKAVASGRAESVQLVAQLGFDLNAMILKRTPMHDAAWEGHVAMIKLLIELGADPDIHDRSHDGTPLEWAEYNQQREAADYLRTVTGT
jgi:ankyrin repeat protein